MSVRHAPVAQWIEHQPPELGVAGSIPAGRTIKSPKPLADSGYGKTEPIPIGQKYLLSVGIRPDKAFVLFSDITPHGGKHSACHAAGL